MTIDPATIVAIAAAARVGAEITAAAAELFERIGRGEEPTPDELAELGLRVESRGERMQQLYNDHDLGNDQDETQEGTDS